MLVLQIIIYRFLNSSHHERDFSLSILVETLNLIDVFLAVLSDLEMENFKKLGYSSINIRPTILEKNTSI